MGRRRWGCLLLVALVAPLLAGCGGTVEDIPLARQAGAVEGPTTTTTAPVEALAAAPAEVVPPTTAPPPPPPPPPPPTTLPPPPPPAVAGAALTRDLSSYGGLGTWVDVYDWSATFTRDGTPAVLPEHVDHMADRGVETLYLQTSKWDSPTDVLEPETVMAFIERAHARGMRVVAWYLPTLEDPAADVRRLLANAALPVDGIGVDIESRKVADVGERNRRLIEVSAALRAALPDTAIAAIPFPPVVMEVVNPSFWPGFPWRELAPLYDVWLPMSYQSDRRADSGYRDAYRYTAENIDRMRVNLGLPHAPIHTIGGIADRTSPADVQGMLQASVERGVMGGSLYDWRTTGQHLWQPLQSFRRPR